MNWHLEHFLCNKVFNECTQKSTDDMSILVQTNDLVPWGNKSLKEPKLTQIYITITLLSHNELNYWGQVTHICISKLTIIGYANVLSPGHHQAIIWINTGILLIRASGTNLNEILNKIHTFSFKKMHVKRSVQWLQFCLGHHELSTLHRSAVYHDCYFHDI